jgi:stage V sporulation protein D (sporulation-specific penicillin-binding protein)
VAEPTFPWRETVRRRAVVGGALLLAWTAAIEGRLVFLQVVRHQELAARADRQQMRTVTAPAKRGEIRDRHGRLLAFSVDVDSIYAVPAEIAEPAATAQALCKALDDCDRGQLKALVERFSKGRAFAFVERFVTPQAAARVAALDLEGVGFMKESRRYYPKKELAAQLLGYVGVDNSGLGGVEAAYDSVVRGRDGKVLVQIDARRRGFSSVERLPTAGGTLELTIDEQLQHIVERELKAGVTANRAESGTAIVMDPHSGEILAMATYPSFNPNAFRSAPELARKNRAVTDLYEPGSTFKIVTASAAIQEGVVSPSDPIDVSAGMIKFPGRPPIEDVARYGVLTFSEVIAKSSNVGAIKVGLRLGAERLGLYVNRFGFGKVTSPDFPGESPGIVWDPSRLNDSALASVSMGYQVGVTPLQMVAAASAVANGGRLLQPRVVRAIVKDGVRTPIVPALVGRPITARTAAELTSIMEDVVDHGTGTQAQLDGFTIAGKSGTAAKLVHGAYSKSEYNVSFVGFAPSRKPVLTAIVMIDTPRAGKYYGGSVSAPIFKRIVDASLRHLGVAPTVFPAPPVLVDRRAQLGEPAGPTVITVAPVDDRDGMPDVRGLGAREALRRLARRRLTSRIQGSGVVISQLPAPGAPLDPNGTCTLILGRNPRALTQAMLGELP